MDNLVEYKDGVAYLTSNNEDWTEQVSSGNGTSKGLELYVEKKKGLMTGWISYTLSKTERKFDDINNGEAFPFKYDHRHNISVLSEYEITKNKKIGIVFNLLSGGTATFPNGKYPISSGLPINFDSRFVEHYESRNSLRLEDFHHLDISYTSSKMKKKFMRSWIFSIYNVYNRKNTFIIYQNEGKLKKVSLFPILPSVTYRIEI